MKRLNVLLLVFFSGFIATAQSNFSGAYGYSFKPEGDPPATEKNRGPKGNLVLMQMEGAKYRFWLDVENGWPYYHVGETDGTITFVNDTASFDNTFEDATNPCILSFKISNNVITINSHSTSFNCGFGQGVNADGDYKKHAVQPVIDNNWLQKEYPVSPQAVITKGKAELYQDENCLYSFSPKKYLLKDQSVINIAETEKSVYTEYFSPQGKFNWGWIKKTDARIIPAK